MHNLNKGAAAPPWLTPVIPIYSVIKTILYMTRLYGKVAFVEALLYLGRSSMEIQHALSLGHHIPLRGRVKCVVGPFAKVYFSTRPLGKFFNCFTRKWKEV